MGTAGVWEISIRNIVDLNAHSLKLKLMKIAISNKEGYQNIEIGSISI